MYLSAGQPEMNVIENTLSIKSILLARQVHCRLFLPDDLYTAEPLNLLLFNDGQEADNLQVGQTLEALYAANKIKPVAIIAIEAGEERLQEYGIAGFPDYKKRGAKADIYTRFIIDELLPAVKAELGSPVPGSIAIAGLSLGGLSAMDIAWNHPEIFDKTGAFSGSFWWRSKDLNKGYTDDDRLMHQLIRNSKTKPALKFWLQTGTKDEVADRNNNGIIDAIDDTVDLIAELENKGYKRPSDIQYVEIVGGEHHNSTWAKALPRFLLWAFGR